MHKILLTGANGQLGRSLKDILKNTEYKVYYTDLKDLDITKQEILEDFILENSIDSIINCAAYTAVDKAQLDEITAEAVNTKAVQNLANLAKMYHLKLIHVSTDYVFDGRNYRPYLESDTPNPESVYGKTKLAGEKAILEMNPDSSAIIRTSWLYSEYGNNFVKTMMNLINEREELSVVYDQIGTPTYAGDLAVAILEVLRDLKNTGTEIYHYSNEGVASWYDFAVVIKYFLSENDKINCNIMPIPSSSYPTPAPRPHYSVLSKEKIKKTFGLKIPYWKDSLEKCMKNLI